MAHSTPLPARDARLPRPRVLVIDMAVAPDSPAGSCVLAEVQGLSRVFDVTVFSERFAPDDLPGVEFVRVWAPQRPVLFRYLAFHVSVPVHLWLWRLRGGRAACVQATQGQLPGADICYAHYCHRAYLTHHWPKSQVAGLRRLARWATHAFNAACEARAVRQARSVVVPSRGLARELAQAYPFCGDKLQVIPNPVAIERFARPADFDRTARRREQGFDASQLVLGFMALGDFSRKGLGLLMDALARLAPDQRARVRLLVIGGQGGEIAEFAAMARQLGVASAVHFVGMQSDVRPFLWVCDAFAFPSSYETFGLAVVQAAAAGLPVMVSEGLHGVEDFVVDGHNGWSIPREATAIAAWLQGVLARPQDLAAMGSAAAATVQPYAVQTFRARWNVLMGDLANGH